MKSGLEYIVALTMTECWLYAEGAGVIVYKSVVSGMDYTQSALPLRTVPLANVRQRLEPRYVVTLWT